MNNVLNLLTVRLCLFSLVLLLFISYSCSPDSKADKTYTVTFDTDGGKPALDPKKVKEDSTSSNPVSNPAKEGFNFIAWHEKGKDTPFKFSSTKISADITIVAKWKQKSFNVTFHTRGAPPISRKQIAWGQHIDVSPPSRSGYTFVAWHTDKSINFSAGNKFLKDSPVTRNLDLYAEWNGDNIVSVPDSAFRNYLIGEIPNAFQAEKMDRGIPDVVSLKTINIDALKGKASSLEGIQYFTELENLTFESHNITSIDLSHNTNLITLNCLGNKLSELILSNPKLINVNCSLNNQLTKLNLNGCTALQVLNINLCDISSLDLSNNKGLSILSCAGNKIAELILNNHPQLTKISADQNTLQSIDIRKSEKISSISLTSQSRLFSKLFVERSVLCSIAIKNLTQTIFALRQSLTIKTYNSGGDESGEYTSEAAYTRACP